jgi:integrase
MHWEALGSALSAAPPLPKKSGARPMKLTASNVKTIPLPDSKTDHFEPDDAMPNFYVRVRGNKAGNIKRNFYVQRRFNGTQYREDLGSVYQVSLTDAREAARIIFGKMAQGINPGAERAKARQQAAIVKLTLADVGERYVNAKRDTLTVTSIKAAKRNFRDHWAALAKRPIGEIGRAEVAAVLQKMRKDYGDAAAARARSVLSSAFVWAMREGLCEVNPIIGTNNPAEALQSRDRVLDNAELTAVWRGVEDDDFGKIVKLLILTGARRSEISFLRWSEISGNTITIPRSRAKNGVELKLTLPPLAMQILESVPRRGDAVFGKNGRGYSRWSFWKDKLDARLGGSVKPWRLHDLRRSAATGMAEIGIEPHIIEAVLNHISGHKGGVAGVYNRARYTEQMRIALQRWANHVAGLLNGRANNVVPLRG